MARQGVRHDRSRPLATLRHTVGLALSVMAILAGCNTAGPPQSASPASSPSPAAVASPPAGESTMPNVAATGPAGTLAACNLDVAPADWTPLPVDSGRCHVTVFSPPMSFEATPGWLWAGATDRWTLTRDNGYFTNLTTYRYGGAVVPPYCEDPPATNAMSAGSDIVAWLGTVPGLEVHATGRTVGSYPAWELDIAAPGVKSCSGDPGKSGLASLWTIDGQPIELPETLSDDQTMRVYLIELPTQIVIMTARTNPIEDMTGIPDNTDFLLRANEIFSSLAFE